MRKIFYTMMLLASAVVAMAQSPAFMNYTCSISGSDGAALADTKVSIKVTFTVEYTLYAETHSVMTDANGLANITIGKGKTTSDSEVSSLDQLPWSAPYGERKMKVEIDPNGGTNYTISGENELSSVPYSLCSNYASTAGYAQNLGNMPLAVVDVKVEGADVEIEFMGKRLSSKNAVETFMVPAFSPIYYSVIAHGKYYTVTLNGEQLKNEKMTYKKTEGVLVNAIGSDNYKYAVEEGISAVTGFSANTMIAGKPMLYSSNNKTYVSQSATEVPSGATCSYNAYAQMPVNGVSFLDSEIDRGELLGKTDVKNRLIGPFNVDGVNTIVIKQSATIPPLY